MVNFLAELFGNRPSPIVYEMISRIGESTSKSWTTFRPRVTVNYAFQHDGLLVHEGAHLFTHYLLPTSEWWFNEGISNKADSIYTGDNCLTPQTTYALKRLQSGENVFYNYPAEVKICVAHWLNVHNTGDLFFEGLKEYGMDGTKFREFLRTLDRYAEEDSLIGIEEIKQAAYEVLDKDISPLLDLLEPGIVYDGLVREQGDLENVKEFFDEHPEYATSHVSWTKWGPLSHKLCSTVRSGLTKLDKSRHFHFEVFNRNVVSALVL